MTTTMLTSDPAAPPTPRPPWVAHFGFATTPFTKRIAARDLLARTAHTEAIARIGFGCRSFAGTGVSCEVGGSEGVG